jgi:DNA-directed RNA polymerase specialized sigma24 family protein
MSENWPAVWGALEAERAEFVRIIRAMLGPGHSKDAAEDLLHSFALEILPRVLARAAGWTEEERGRYLRAALRNFVRSAHRTHARQERALAVLASEVMSEPVDSTEALDPTLLARAIEFLPPRSGLAVRAFLGVEGEPRSIREIAKQLGLTRYATRTLVQDGMLGAAILLRRTGVLSPLEVEACRRLILDGQEPESVARSLALPLVRIRRALERARQVVAHALG